MNPERIDSRDNPRLRHLVEIASSARARRASGECVLEGIHPCAEYLRTLGPPKAVALTQTAMDNPEVAPLLPRGLRPLLLGERLFGAISQMAHPVGIAYLIDVPRPAIPSLLDTDCVYLDALQDPGNVGTVLRTCAAVGIGRVFCAPGTAACWSPKVLRAAMGAHFALKLHEQIDWRDLPVRGGMVARATLVGAHRSLYQQDLTAPTLWVFGNEGAGISASIDVDPEDAVAIPQCSGVESLNVAAAAAVCLYEQYRQRQASRDSG